MGRPPMNFGRTQAPVRTDRYTMRVRSVHIHTQHTLTHNTRTQTHRHRIYRQPHNSLASRRTLPGAPRELVRDIHATVADAHHNHALVVAIDRISGVLVGVAVYNLPLEERLARKLRHAGGGLCAISEREAPCNSRKCVVVSVRVSVHVRHACLCVRVRVSVCRVRFRTWCPLQMSTAS